MVEATWFYQQGGQAVGPISTAELCQKFSSGELPLETLVYGESIKSWTAAERISGFRQAVPRTGATAAADSTCAQAPDVPAAPAAPLAPDLSGTTQSPVPVAPTTLPAVPTALPAASAPVTTTPRPWLRLLARWTDSCLFWLVAACALNYVILPALPFMALDRDPRRASIPFLVALLVVETVAWFIASAASLSFFGTTPAKWLLGIRVRNESNAPPTFGQAMLRELGVFGLGMGLGLGPISLLLMVLSYVRLIDQGVTRWDRMLRLHVEHRACPGWRVATALVLPAVGFSTLAVGSVAAGLHAAAAQHVEVAARSVSLPNLHALTRTLTVADPQPMQKIVDPRVLMVSGTWVSLTPTHVGKAKFTLRNTLTLNDDGTFRQSLRAIDAAGKSHSDLGHQCSGTWQLNGDHLVQNISLSSTPDYPIGKWSYDLVSATGDAMTLRRSGEPVNFVYAGRKPVFQYQRMTATVRAD